ncbi:hypothetical protein OEZ60_06935 [Defluviimonas sp. WL0024]|uniref:OST-HTH/LOTUS domain-containing protein n=1 Tax=Albidovulum salinarum TaxID=2984153 RepID=A0ABT2X1C3_9RHOB|nr:hypothetical protein [Defluviimonas sp. WL0024]MCU9847739.1 hypothetical protein [Defluviimonas sp. WL0024]
MSRAVEPPADDELKRLQIELEHLLGRCLLKLQHYEGLIKAIIADHKISGSVHDLEAIREERAGATARKTLGSLVGDFLGSCVVANEIDTPTEATADSSEIANSFSSWIYTEYSDADFARIQSEMKELVDLRNNLVHHFIDQHSLGTLDGCRSGRDALVAANSRIDEHLKQLKNWAEEFLQVRRILAEFLGSDAATDFIVNGIRPDGTVWWPGAGIVYALRGAARRLAVDGWTSLAAASKWIAEVEPEQIPKRYGCRSWHQVVNEARVFDLRYFEVDGQRVACYRERTKCTANGSLPA